MKKIKIIGVVVVLVAVAGLVWFWSGGNGKEKQQLSNKDEKQFTTLDAVDTVLSFYDKWQKAMEDGANADPSRTTLIKSPILSKQLQEKLANAEKNSGTTVDPVLCQIVVPKEISIRRVYSREDETQIVVTSKDKKVTNQAIVTLRKQNGGWYINDIECSLGEFAPPREFSFEKEGYLLKASVPKPYKPENWHLVFEEDGTNGHVAPLFFDSTSQCTGLDGNKSVCIPDKFVEATKVFVRAQMSEKGATVKQLEFVK